CLPSFCAPSRGSHRVLGVSRRGHHTPLVSGPLSHWLSVCTVLHTVPSVEIWIWYCVRRRLPSFGQHAHQVRHRPPPHAPIATTHRRIPMAVMSRPASCACSSSTADGADQLPAGWEVRMTTPVSRGFVPASLNGGLPISRDSSVPPPTNTGRSL